MGLELAHVLSDERHHGQFQCAICQNLCGLDALVTTVCSHVFCRVCLVTWLRRMAHRRVTTTTTTTTTGVIEAHSGKDPPLRCPTCNADLDYATSNANKGPSSSSSSSQSQQQQHPSRSRCRRPVSLGFTTMLEGRNVYVCPLVEAQPLAHRVLGRIRVACPLHGCEWKGDYEDLTDHQLSETAHRGTTTTTTKTAEETKTTTNNEPSSSLSLSQSPSPNQDHNMEIHNNGPSQSQQQQQQQPPQSPSPSPLSPSQQQQQQQGQQQKTKQAKLEPNVVTVNHCKELAESFKVQADATFSSGNYGVARDLYTKALKVLNTNTNTTTNTNVSNSNLQATLLANRAATHLSLQHYPACIDDCRECLALKPDYVKAYLRLSGALIATGQFAEAVRCLESSSSFSNDPSMSRRLTFCRELQQRYEAGLTFLSEGRYAEAASTLGQLMSLGTGVTPGTSRRPGGCSPRTAPPVLLAAARADLALGRIDRSLRWTSPALLQTHFAASSSCSSSSSSSTTMILPEALTVRGHATCLRADRKSMDEGLALFREALRLDPDIAPPKSLLRSFKRIFQGLQTARDAFRHRRFVDAEQELTLLIDMNMNMNTDMNPTNNHNEGVVLIPRGSPLHAILYTERGWARHRQKCHERALQDAAHAIHGRDDWADAWVLRASAYAGLGRHAEARDQLASILWSGGGASPGEPHGWAASVPQLRAAYDRADFEVRKAARPDFYQLFGLSPLVTNSQTMDREIRQKYKARAAEWHPDKFAGPQFTDAQRAHAKRQFQLLGEGLEILTDDFRRQLYDEGYDAAAIRERVAMAEQAQRHGHSHRHSHGRH